LKSILSRLDYYLPTDNNNNTKDVSSELTKDRRALEKKKAQLIKDLEMVNADRERYSHDREKYTFF